MNLLIKKNCLIYLTDNKCSTFNEPILFKNDLIESFSLFQFHSLRNKELLFDLKIIKLEEFSIKSFQSFKMSLLYSNFYKNCYIMKHCFWKLCNFFNSLRLVYQEKFIKFLTLFCHHPIHLKCDTHMLLKIMSECLPLLTFFRDTFQITSDKIFSLEWKL
jgi:hypothetical protein